MFYYISGTLALCTPTMAVIDCSGVGYKLTISANTLSKLAGKDGTKVKLYTYFSVREDAQELYGFFTEEEHLAFTMLISVSGVGPKAAIAILSVLTPEKLSLAISTGNAKEISKAQGVGAKTAARVVLELKDSAGKLAGDSDVASYDSVETVISSDSKLADVEAALTVLGYSRSEVAYSLRGVDKSLDAEEIIRLALRNLMK
ncbi:MAG: Holliday junction branch migration protein RuvA [Clostridia bacterium]|nr:Holliday junction branch migration protein RuvA [Clostridia bacterium]